MTLILFVTELTANRLYSGCEKKDNWSDI